MSQLKFIRSKSTSRSNPLGRLQQKLKQVQKPGKLHVSVGRSRQSSQTNEDLPIYTPKHKMDVKLLSLHQIDENTIPTSTLDGWHSLLPLSHDMRLINDSNKLKNASQYNMNIGNIYNKQHFYTQTNCCSPKLSERVQTEKLDGLQLKSTKLNSSEQNSTSGCFSNTTSKFNFNQISLKQSQFITQQSNSENELYKLYSSTNNNNKFSNENQTINQEQIKSSQSKENPETIILDIYPTFPKKNQATNINTKPILEQNEDDELQGMKCSTKSSQRQVPRFYSEVLTDKSIVINNPKILRETEIQTSFTSNQFTDTIQLQQLNQTCKSTTNASVQTKIKNKNLGLFQYQLSYLSPQVNKQFLEADLLSLDFQSQIVYETQNNIQQNNENNKFKKIDFNDRSQCLNQKSNIYLTKELLLHPEEDYSPIYLQAEPKEINPNQSHSKFNNKRSISKEFSQNSCTSISKSKIEKCASFQSIKSYKDHLNILLNQTSQTNCKIDQNQPYIVQQKKTNKQKYPLRNQQSNSTIAKKSKPKQFKKN